MAETGRNDGTVMPAAPGYAHPAYIAALDHVGQPLALPRSRGWLLERPIGDTGFHDAIGPYPLFACQDWAVLADDLAALDDRLVSVGIVTDPFGTFSEADLARAFPDRVLPYKAHFVVDLDRVSPATLDPHHRRNIRWASRRVTVERIADPLGALAEWEALYEVLRQRHGITGAARFSEASFARQLAMPDLVAFRAVADGETVGMVLWIVQGDVAYYHLAAYSDRGYELKASFALFQAAIDFWAGDKRWLALGAGAGVTGDETDGLTRFKAGWATDRRQVYFCGRIGQPARYTALADDRQRAAGTFFPAYRA